MASLIFQRGIRCTKKAKREDADDAVCLIVKMCATEKAHNVRLCGKRIHCKEGQQEQHGTISQK